MGIVQERVSEAADRFFDRIGTYTRQVFLYDEPGFIGF